MCNDYANLILGRLSVFFSAVLLGGWVNASFNDESGIVQPVAAEIIQYVDSDGSIVEIVEIIDPWEEAMALSADYLMQKRMQLINQLTNPLYQNIKTLSWGKDIIEMSYQNSLPFSDKETLIKQWQTQRKREFILGHTLNGPHRDDLSFSIDDLSSKSFASEGQKHSIVAALRLSQWEHLKEYTLLSPTMSIDDFGAHLDQNRQIQFQEMLSNLGQIFVTSPKIIPTVFPNKEVIEIDSGEVKTKVTI